MFPQISTEVLNGKLEKTALQGYDLPFLYEGRFKQAQQPRLHGKPHHQPRWEAVRTPQQTAIYLLKSLRVQDIPEALSEVRNVLTEMFGRQKCFDCKVPTLP